jgi:hypothetical protein
MNGFDDFDTTITAEEYYHQPTLGADGNLCTQCEQKEAVEDGFCSFDCENTAFAELPGVTVEWADPLVRELDNSGMYDDFLSQYDDDPSPYGGTYSEE